ncbi:hypothetical protein HYV79_00800 [Candidatus Woesearchaeota archaeon]|nr:hypothetical protein [Candidatus Woesearchaeota archaeon]
MAESCLKEYPDIVLSVLKKIVDYARTYEEKQHDFLDHPAHKSVYYEYDTMRGIHASIIWIISDFQKYVRDLKFTSEDQYITDLSDFFLTHKFESSAEQSEQSLSSIAESLSSITTLHCIEKLHDIKRTLAELIRNDISGLKNLDLAKLI